MAYEPTNWQTGDIITADKLNKLEEGISNSTPPYDVIYMNLRVDIETPPSEEGSVGFFISDISNNDFYDMFYEGKKIIINISTPNTDSGEIMWDTYPDVDYTTINIDANLRIKLEPLNLDIDLYWVYEEGEEDSYKLEAYPVEEAEEPQNNEILLVVFTEEFSNVFSASIPFTDLKRAHNYNIPIIGMFNNYSAIAKANELGSADVISFYFDFSQDYYALDDRRQIYNFSNTSNSNHAPILIYKNNGTIYKAQKPKTPIILWGAIEDGVFDTQIEFPLEEFNHNVIMLGTRYGTAPVISTPGAYQAQFINIDPATNQLIVQSILLPTSSETGENSRHWNVSTQQYSLSEIIN